MRGWFLRRKLDKDQKGFSLIEMVIAIPLIALSGGFVVAIIGQSVGVVNTNRNIDKSGIEVQNIMDKAKNASTCYDLDQLKGNTPFKSASSKTDFTIRTTYTPTCAMYGSSSKNQLISVESIAREGTSASGKILFKNQTSVRITG